MRRLPVTYPSHDDPSASPFEFQWDVTDGGYRWENALPAAPRVRQRDPASFITDGYGLGMSRAVWRYSPLRRHPALFRTFADLKPTPEAVCTFANEFGLLGGEADAMIALPVSGEPDGSPTMDIGTGTKYFVATGETLGAWAQQIDDMRRLVELWLAATVNRPLLPERIYWYGDRVAYQHGTSWSIIAGIHIKPDLFSTFERGDLEAPALYHLQREVNERVRERVTAQLLWDRDRHLRLHVVPRSLLGALWLQFARAIEGGRRYLRCDMCGRWLEISPEVRRSDARHCSGACRTRAYRARRRDRSGRSEIHARVRTAESIPEPRDPA